MIKFHFIESQAIRLTKPLGDFCYYNKNLNSKSYLFFNIIEKFILTKPIHLQNIISKEVHLGRKIFIKL